MPQRTKALIIIGLSLMVSLILLFFMARSNEPAHYLPIFLAWTSTTTVWTTVWITVLARRRRKGCACIPGPARGEN